ncbi:MAG: hypothetical protein D6741_14685 [Planctomycetota bacterium]|nr:MAG: hypothetical protein D6741_14685 [Planctomycetota bacterium]
MCDAGVDFGIGSAGILHPDRRALPLPLPYGYRLRRLLVSRREAFNLPRSGVFANTDFTRILPELQKPEVLALLALGCVRRFSAVPVGKKQETDDLVPATQGRPFFLRQ